MAQRRDLVFPSHLTIRYKRDMRPTMAQPPSGLERPGVRVRTLVELRWIAILGQLATLGFVDLWLGFPLPLPSALAAVGASAVLNLGLLTLYRRNARLEGSEAALHLAFDLAQLGVLLFLTGGLANPFAVLLLVPVTIAATLLPTRAAVALLAFALSILAALWRWALPLPWGDAPLLLPEIYRIGVLIGIALGMLFLCIYAGQVSAEARRRAQALIATQAALEREAKMSALGSLAAAAAHELGGPLGTITLVARELADALAGDPDFGGDVALLDREAKRCRDILVNIAHRAEAEEPFARASLAAVLHEVAHGIANGRAVIIIDIDERLTPDPLMLRRTPELLHGLSNLVANAVRHAHAHVTLTAAWDSRDVRVSIRDDGDGFAPALLPRLGEPFLGPSRSGAGGTGLGIFIATTLLERTGAQLDFSNQTRGGAQVDIRWPRSHIEDVANIGEEGDDQPIG